MEHTEPTLPQQVTLRFKRTYRAWNRGVEAGFPSAEAERLIAAGIAVAIVPTQREPLAGRVVRKG
jgi:hypothetical protein